MVLANYYRFKRALDETIHVPAEYLSGLIRLKCGRWRFKYLLIPIDEPEGKMILCKGCE